MKFLLAAFITLELAAPIATAGRQITTSQYDNMRTGSTLTEKTLTPQNVNVGQFGKLGAFKVDGAVYAQPLFVPAVEIPGKGKRDVLFVATEHDSVYAFDADRPNDAPLWHVSFLDSGGGVTAVPARDVQCPFIQPEVGITSTPVIDLKTGTLYVLARTMINATLHGRQYYQHLHALAITTGAEKLNGPKLITASSPGKGDGSVNGQVAFNPLRENPRASLLLVNNNVFLMWASSCDVNPYHGWVMAYDAATLSQKAALNVTPDGNEGGIWASDTGPGADGNGNVYIATGNGTFNVSTGGHDYGDSILKLALEGNSLIVRDFFTPYNQQKLSDADADLGSSGPTLLPDQPGPHKHLLLQPTKGGSVYVVDRDNMGKFHNDKDEIIQQIKMAGGAYGAMSYWNGHVFFACEDDQLRDYVIVNGELKLNGSSSTKFANPGATPSISANGTKDAIVWAIATKTWNGPDQPAVLYAYNASNISQPIYSSEQNSTRDRATNGTRFSIPAVFNGRVYFGVRGEVEVYGLLKPTAAHP
jgi:hypothetical protein